MNANELADRLRALAAEYHRGIDHWGQQIPAPSVTAKWEYDAATLTAAADLLARFAPPADVVEAAKVLQGMEGPIIRGIRGKRYISEREHCAAMAVALHVLPLLSPPTTTETTT